jgi:hypothetical protein
MSDYRADQYLRNYSFRVEWSPGPPSDQTHGKWKSIKGGGLRFHEDPGGVGQDKFKETTLACAEWEDLILTGEVTAERKDMLQWYKDMVEKGTTKDCYRTVTLTWMDRAGGDIGAITWNECFMTAYSMCELNREAEDQNAIETIEVCTGYSEDYLG